MAKLVPIENYQEQPQEQSTGPRLVPIEQYAEQAKPLAWSDVPGQALSNAPGSAVDLVKGIYQAVRHPINTVSGIGDAVSGGLRKLQDPDVMAATSTPDTVRANETANAIGGFYKDRYGSVEGLKQTLAKDPVGALADVSTVLTGGAGLAKGASKIPMLTKGATTTADILRKASAVTNPVNIAAKGISKAVPYVGGKVADVIGGLGTHTGGESLRQAARSGMQGGGSAKTFTQNMRGKVPMTDVLETAKANLDDIGRAKSAEYRAGMAQVSGDKTVLKFNGIDKAIQDAAQNVTFKGQVKNQKAADVLQKIADDVDQWKNLDPVQYHTPEGMDALKQRVGAMVESIPFEEKTARMVGNKIYHSIKGEITQQAPVYSDVMKGYSEASDQIKEIERALSLGKKASIDTAMRKLQSLTRNNVNTNYGNRAALAKQLEAQGGREIMPSLAGQALNSWTPRGLGGAVAGGLGLGGYAVGGAPLAIPMLAAQSPRLMGEAALKAGQSANLINKGWNMPSQLTGGLLDSAQLANLLYQAGRLPQQ